MTNDLSILLVNVGIFIATAGAAAVAWWQAVEASRSRVDARQAERMALEARQAASDALAKANDQHAVSMRAPYAYALAEMSSALFGARMAGFDQNKLLNIINEKVFALTEKRFLAGDVPADEITKWAGRYPRFVDVGEGFDFDRWSRANRVMFDRITLWLRDPEAAERAVRDDPGFEEPADA